MRAGRLVQKSLDFFRLHATLRKWLPTGFCKRRAIRCESLKLPANAGVFAAAPRLFARRPRTKKRIGLDFIPLCKKTILRIE
jgi:hypothetical protein